MKKASKILLILNIIIIAAAGTITIWQLFFTEEPDFRLLTKALFLFVGYLLAISGIKRKRSINPMIYKQKYKEQLRNAFSSDGFSLRRLLKAIALYNENKPAKAIAALDKTYKNCLYADDFCAVLLFKALCLEEQGNYYEAAECYKELLEHDKTHATAWSNLGLVYQNLGRGSDSLEAYQNSIRYDPTNDFAYNNLASYYIRNGEPEKGLECALKGLELNSKMYQSMGAAAMAYKMLGDEANAEKYRIMYSTNGGDGKSLKAVLENL